MSLPDPDPPPIPDELTVDALRAAAQACRACELWEDATQAVMGHWERPPRAGTTDVMLIGEQPGDRVHVAACRPWLEAELAMVRPRAVVLLGATAAQALLGSQVRVGRDRGRPVKSDLADLVTLTTHPSAILRLREEEERAAAMDAFVSDLSEVARRLGNG